MRLRGEAIAKILIIKSMDCIMKISEVDTPSDSELAQLAAGLRSYNQAFVKQAPTEKVATFVKSGAGEVLGGCYGVINWGWLYIDWLWCHESIRGQGYGTQLMARMEKHALSKGIHHIKLETADFQALGFYQKLGYSVYGELENYPIGHKNYYLKKVVAIQ